MVVLNKIYTRTGDAGSTALGTGERRKKHDLRIAAYGTIDETNAAIGLARLHAKGKTETGLERIFAAGEDQLDAMLARIQNDLFDLGADLCTPEKRTTTRGRKRPARERLRILDSQVRRLEDEIDRLNGELTPLNSFVLPGGAPAAAYLHLARTICRRAERLIVELSAKRGETVSPAALKYVNRLSDFLFVAARYANDKGASDVLWVPGQNR
jgi:cob(I)alamin adenosyltransferase